MEEGLIDLEVVFVADEEASEVTEPGESALDLPALAVAAQRPAVLRGWRCASASMRTDQFDVLCGQAAAQRVAVAGAIGDESPRAMGQKQTLDYRFDEGDFRRGRTGEAASQRNTRAVDHRGGGRESRRPVDGRSHHPLRAFALLGFADSKAPLFAGAKLASMKASPQSSLPASLSCSRKPRHKSSQTPCSSHCCRRRQHKCSRSGAAWAGHATVLHCAAPRGCLRALRGFPPTVDRDSPVSARAAPIAATVHRIETLVPSQAFHTICFTKYRHFYGKSLPATL